MNRKRALKELDSNVDKESGVEKVGKIGVGVGVTFSESKKQRGKVCYGELAPSMCSRRVLILSRPFKSLP